MLEPFNDMDALLHYYIRYILVTRTLPFSHLWVSNVEYRLRGAVVRRVEDDHLSKIVGLTGENFTEKMLAKCRKRDEYFDETG